MKGRGLQMIDAETVHRLADWPGLIEAMRQCHLGPKPMGGRLLMTQPRAQGQPDALIIVPAWQEGKAIGIKLVTSFPENTVRFGLPTVDAIYVLFDPHTGKPSTIIDGEALVFRKTASDTALGVKFLSSPSASRFLMVGAGSLAPYVIDAVRSVRPDITEIAIWNRTNQRAIALADHIGRSDNAKVYAIENLSDGLGWADIVISATMSEKPLIAGANLKSGAHVGLIGSFTTGMREADDDLMRRAAIYTDDLSAIEKTGEFIDPISRGVISRADILGDLFTLCQGRCPPQDSGRVTVFKNGGAAHLDLFVAQYVMRVFTPL